MPKPSFRSLLVLFLFGWLLVVPPAPVSAQSGKTVLVKQRDAEITILQNGDVQFVETWVVEFQYGTFTFAFREIPKNKLREISDWSVSEGDRIFEKGLRTDSFSVDETDEKYKITWRFPATNQGANAYSDVHTFTLKYTLHGAMRVYPQGDQFWWKFVEADRAYTIASSRVILHLPQEFPVDQIKATTYLNYNETYGARVIDGKTIEFNGGPFPSDVFWEIRAQFPHVIPAPPEEWQKWDDYVEQTAAQNNLYAAVAFVVMLIGGPLFLLVLWYLVGRDKPTTFAAEFLPKPPDEDTPPGVVGTLLDERADLQDILATVADLAQRGFLRIREADAFGAPEYQRVANRKAKFEPFEREMMTALFGNSDRRTLDDLRGSFYYRINDLQNALYDEVVARGYFPASPLATRDFYFRIARWGAILTPVLGLASACVWILFAPLLFLPLLALEIFFIGLLGLSRVMPRRTPKGAAAAAQWNAFKRYLAHVEKYTTIQAAQDKFAEYLPYAIAFGLERSWFTKFQQTNVPAPKWYVPFRPTMPEIPWQDIDTAGLNSSRSFGSVGANGQSTSTASPSSAPLFRDSSSDNQGGTGAPDLDSAASGSFTTLNRVSGNMFDFLNSSASAFTAKPAAPGAAESIFGGVGDFLNWVGSSPGGSSSGSSSSGSSSSSSSSSSHSGWSGGGSGGGRGGGGGSSGFG